MSEGFDPNVALDLTGADADAVGFPPIPSGQYQAHVAKAEWRATDNLDGSKALPHETPYLSLGIQVNDPHDEVNGEKVAGRYAGFTNLFIPPADYDAGKAAQMKNRMANFLNAIGEDWQKKGYKMPSVDELVGKQLTVIVRKKRDASTSSGFANEIEGFKPEGAASTSGDPLLV